MARLESTLVNMLMSLSVVALASAGILGVTYIVTKQQVIENRLAKEVGALKKVLPEFDNDPVADKYVVETDRGELAFYPGKMGGKVVGTAIESLTTKGYSGLIRLLVGITSDGKVFNIEVLEHKETPGLGAKIESTVSNFVEQFKNKDLHAFILKVKKDGGNVDGITAATISSRAYCDAVQFAYDVFRSHAKN